MITFILAVCGNVDYVYSFPQSPPSRAAWIEMSSKVAGTPLATSPPSRAAWIEIVLWVRRVEDAESPPSRAAWIEMSRLPFCDIASKSPPSRAAWIEISIHNRKNSIKQVAAFTGGVD